MVCSRRTPRGLSDSPRGATFNRAFGAASAGESPIEIIDALARELDAAVTDLFTFCSSVGVDLAAMRDAEGFDHVAKRDAAVEALLVDEETRNDFQQKARQVRKLFKALLPDPSAAGQQRNVAAIRVLAERIAEVTRPPEADLGTVADAVDFGIPTGAPAARVA